jgi:hypothetical protein
MFIAFISYSYTEGISDNDEVQESLEEELKKQPQLLNEEHSEIDISILQIFTSISTYKSKFQ